LLYLEQSTAETTDATISAVTTSGFTVAAALASGTYRWIALAEIEGFLKLFRYAPNNSTEGTYARLGLSAAFLLFKRSITGGDGLVFDSVRNSYNINNTKLIINTTAGDATLAALDTVSGGLKMRVSGQDPNATGTQVGISLGAFPFRYANAR